MPKRDFPFETLMVSVRPSPETNDHEVLLRSEHGDLIARFGDGMIGLDPDHVLLEPCPLVPRGAAHTALIGRCDCGVVGCGSVEVTIHREGDSVVWSAPSGDPTVRFDATQYVTELERALVDFSWETPDRTAARLIRDAVDRKHLEQHELEFQWASGRIESGVMVIALLSSRDRRQVLVRVPCSGESPENIAKRCCEVLYVELGT